MTITIDDIHNAADTIRQAVVRTPTVRSGPLSDLIGADVFLKLETLQYTGSFKDRGACVKLSSLDSERAQNGVIAVSAGNHAQGVAYHAKRLGIPATIVMPTSTPFTKINRTEALGARVLLFGDSVSACTPHAKQLMRAEGLTFIHPFDDPYIIAGQGTVGLEILEDVPDLDVLIAPIGGGGLIAGVATALRSTERALDIVGVEAALYPSMAEALKGGEAPSGGETIAEGIAIKKPGKLTLPIVRNLVDRIVTVDEMALEDSVQTMLVTGKTLAEGAGAAALAAAMAEREKYKGKKIVLVVSGANIDSRILSSVLMRGLVRSGQMVRLRVLINDAPGILAKVTAQIGDMGANIVEIVHQRMFYDVPVKQAEADFVLETRDSAHVEKIVDRLETAGFPTTRLSYTAQPQ